MKSFSKGTDCSILPIITSATLKKCGKAWKYALPEYTQEERAFIHAIVFEWLFESGITATGTL
jgi:hypothetical protein